MSDRSSPVFTVRVIPPGSPAARLDESTRVMSLSYEDNEKLADKLILTVDNFDLALFDDPQFAQGNTLEVSWGFPGNMSAPRQCVIVKTTGFQVLTVEAHGKAILMNKIARTRVFSNMSRSAVARQIAEENGYGVDLQDIEDTGAPLPQITQARLTDWQLLRSLAGREGFELWVDAIGFHFHNRRLGQKPRRKFVFYVGNPEITSINIENDITARPGAIVTKGVDPMTKKPFSFTADNHGTAGRPALGPVVGVPEQDNAAEAVSKVGAITQTTKDQLKGATPAPTTETTEEAAKKQAIGVYSRAMTTAVQLTMGALGDPQVTAKSVIEIAGIGTRLSGNYYVVCATHKVDGGGYNMNLKTRRDGTSSGVGAKSDGKVNKQKGPDDPGADLDVFEKVDNVGNKSTQYKPAGSSKGAGA